MILAKERKRNRKERDEGKEGERVVRKNWRKRREVEGGRGEGRGRKRGVVDKQRDKVKLVSMLSPGLLCARNSLGNQKLH